MKHERSDGTSSDGRRMKEGASGVDGCFVSVGEDPLDEREDAARSLQKLSAAVAILDTGRMGLDDEAGGRR